MKNKYVTRVLFSREEIEKKCQELARWVNKEYKNSNNLVVVGLLKGSLPFISQLIKSVNVLHTMDFMTVSSYGGNTQSSTNVKIIMDLKHDVKEKDVLLVEDIIDSGITLSAITQSLKQRKPKSLKTLTLINKNVQKQNDFKPDKWGFLCENEFLVGFGLDYKEKLRNLPYIGVFNTKYLDKI